MTATIGPRAQHARVAGDDFEAFVKIAWASQQPKLTPPGGQSPAAAYEATLEAEVSKARCDLYSRRVGLEVPV